MYTYFVHRNGKTIGPFPASQLVAMLRNGKLSIDDLGVESGCEDWQPLRDIVDPAVLAPRPPTQPSEPSQVFPRTGAN